MHKPIRTEYENLRKEIESIKKCITDYQGYLFTSLGVLITAWGLTASLQQNSAIARHAVGSVALAASLIVTFMMAILVYKFVSHNRTAGYSLLLTSEIWPPEYDNVEIITWELCVSWLRANESPGGARVLDAYQEMQDAFMEEKRTAEPSTFISGTVFLFQALTTFQKSSSWGFPVTVVRIFAFTAWALVLAGSLLHDDTLQTFAQAPLSSPWPTVLLWAAVVALQLLLWLNIAQRFHSVMVGNSTVLRFAHRFLPLRRDLLLKSLKFSPPSMLEKQDRPK